MRIGANIERNSAQGHGGGLAVFGNAVLNFTAGAVLRNNSALGSGGCAYIGGGPLSFG